MAAFLLTFEWDFISFFVLLGKKQGINSNQDFINNIFQNYAIKKCNYLIIKMKNVLNCMLNMHFKRIFQKDKCILKCILCC